jgi:hypothetical protein
MFLRSALAAALVAAAAADAAPTMRLRGGAPVTWKKLTGGAGDPLPPISFSTWCKSPRGPVAARHGLHTRPCPILMRVPP